MQNPSHAELEELFREIIVPFYHIRRDIRVPFEDRHLENDAEHSWSLAFLACALAPKIDSTLDIGLIAQFATVHDIAEVYAGDTSNFASDDEKATKAEREAAALHKIATKFAHFPWIAKMAERYEARDSDEAKFVYALDKYIPVMFDHLDEGEYVREIKLSLDDYRAGLKQHREKAQTHPAIGKYYDEIRALVESHYDNFHQKNREI